MALTQMQIIQSLGEAMSWFERELVWEVKPAELRHLSGRIGELYAALITNGQMAQKVNQKGYDVVSGLGEKVSVKTTTRMGSTGSIDFNLNTLDQVDRVMILRINTEEMQIETLLDETLDNARKIMSDKPQASGKVSITLSKLIQTPKDLSNISTVNEACYGTYKIVELENGSVEVTENEKRVSPVKPILRKMASKLNVSLFNSNGNEHNTRQLASLLVRAIQVRAIQVGAKSDVDQEI